MPARKPSRKSQREAAEQQTAAPAAKSLPQELGNQAMGQLLNAPQEVQQQLGMGQTLNPQTRQRLEQAFSTDLSHVQIHDDKTADQLARQMDANAFAVGEHIAFRQGEYQPNTPMGEALIAHEVAHTLQQQDARAASQNYGAMERDANQATFGALGRFMLGMRNVASAAMPRMRSGLQIQRGDCIGPSNQLEAPTWMGPESRQAVDDINYIISTMDAADQVIVYGTIATLATSTPAENVASGGYDVSPQAQGLLAIDVIKFGRVIQVIQLLIVTQGNSLTQREKDFWEATLRVFNRQFEQANDRFREGMNPN